MSHLLANNITSLVGPAVGTFSIPLAASSGVGITARLAVRQSSNGDFAYYEVKFAVKRVSSGVATLVGTPVVVAEQKDDAGWAFAVNVDGGNNAIVTVTPSAGDTVSVRAEFQLVRNPL